MICTSCTKDIQPFFEIEPGVGAIEKCPVCYAVQPKVQPPQPVTNSGVAQLAVRSAVNREDTGSNPVARASANNTNPIKLIKERLKFLKQEIKQLRKYEKEAAKLETLLSAAKQPRTKTVRSLHAVVCK